MKDFLDKDFLLESDAAKKLFHEYAEKMPICDYHCHLSPKEIYENNQPNNISDLWLSGDHYKWRAMRSCGVEEKYCTGDASPKEKFEKFAYTLQYCIGNPLYHWAHIELQRYFGIDTPLNAKTADDIYERANKAIANGDFAPQSLITKSNVKVVCTTDDPVDDLKYHKLLKMLTVLIARFCRLSDLTRRLIFILTALQIILKNSARYRVLKLKRLTT